MLYDFGPRLRRLRKKRGWIQKALAEKVGKKDTAISSYETGLQYPTLETALKLAELFDVSVDFLLLGERAETLSIKALNKNQRQLVQSLVLELNAASSTGKAQKLTPSQVELIAQIVLQFSS